MEGPGQSKFAVFLILVSLSLIGILLYGSLQVEWKTTSMTDIMLQLQLVDLRPKIPPPCKSRIWQACDEIGDVFVYSAHYREVEQEIRVVGMGIRTKNRTVTCTFPDQGSKDVSASVEILPEHLYKPTGALFIGCPLREKSYKPKSIGINIGRNVTFLEVLYPEPRKFNFTVCVACLFGPYSDYSRIIETIETDFMFGADHFVLYNYSISPEVDKVLRFYVQNGKIEILPWNLPKANIIYFGQLAQIQDCILSNRGRTKYVVLKDLDELIVPHKHRNWYELMDSLDTGKHNRSTFLFLNSFFQLNVRTVIPRKPGSPKINSLMYVWRDAKIFPVGQRCKTIFRPELIQIGGVHFPWKENVGYTTFNVSHEIAYVHHYRTHRPYRDKVEDVRMLDFRDMLVQKINKTFTDIGLKRV